MIRILQSVNDMHRAGLETMLMNYYRNIDRNLIQFDFLTHRPYKSDYDDEITAMGGKMFYAPRLYPQNYPAYFKWMKAFFNEHPEYKIIHSHIDSMSYLPLLAAKKSNVPVRIAHSHNTSIDKDFKYLLKQYFKKRINSVANVHFACGEEAGRFLFGNEKFTVIPNAVDPTKFYYSKDEREAKRQELGLSNEFTVGHVGRLSYQKNHAFLLDIFNEIQKLEPNSKLLLIGEGEKEQEIRQKADQLGLSDKVIFLGNRKDVASLYQAMDVFVLPSLFEGIPVVGVEAQFSDLPCFFSNTTPIEVKFNRKSKFIGLDSSSADWANAVLSARETERSANNPDLANSHYNVKNTVGFLQDYYLKAEENIH